jgi:hypothetical protein
VWRCFRIWKLSDRYISLADYSLGPPLWSSGQSSWLHNGVVLCLLWGTNWIYICYVEESRPPLWSSGQSSWLQNGDVLCFLWGTNCIYICYVEESRPPLWSSGQSSCLQNGDVLCFLWGTNWIYICYVEKSSSPLWPEFLRRSQYNLKLNLRHCTANYRPILSSERAPYIKRNKKVIATQRNVTSGLRFQSELNTKTYWTPRHTGWLTVSRNMT